MAVATYKDLCIDAVDTDRMARFWSEVLGRSLDDAPTGAVLHGPTAGHRIWINGVPQEKSVKQRVHLDVYAASLADLEHLGASVVDAEAGTGRWTVMADPEGGEFCAFLRDTLPEERLHGLVVDSADHVAQSEWWARVYDADVVHHPSGYSTVQGVHGMPITTFDFVPVPEAKAVKNRVHWDVTVCDPEDLVRAGATLVRARDAEITWDVFGDPEGNEFCAFTGEGDEPS